MKIIAINRTFSEPLKDAPSATVIPDSAIVLPGKPLFIPDFAERWEGELSIAVRIGRLGKNISQRFAERYCDGIALALRIVPAGFEDCSGREGNAIATAFDNAIQIGQWKPMSIGEPLTIICQDKETTVSSAAAAIERSITVLSRYMTLKTGDIILTGTLPTTLPVAIDTQLSASLNSLPNLTVRFK